MKSLITLALQCLPFLISLTFLSSPATATSPFRIPRLSVPGDHERFSASGEASDWQTYYYTQTLDHFNYNPPILAYLGAETPLDSDIAALGFLPENAPRFNVLLVYTEHRYYGESIPFGATMEEAMSNASTLGYFNSAQALADYAEVLIYLKKKLRALDSPVIVVGGSYGGMLASWFRLKYPHVTIGALASSAPILYFDNITPQSGYYSVVTKDFKEVSNNCYRTIKNSWSEIDRVASLPNGLSILSNLFKTCVPLSGSDELKNYLDSMYIEAAQSYRPPKYPVTMVCGGIDGAPKGSDILAKIAPGVTSYRGNRSCYVNSNIISPPSQTAIGWSWQMCSEMVMPIGRKNDTMFQPEPFDMKSFIEVCTSYYGVRSRSHWVTSYYGGHDIKLVLSKFASNIIFSNGLRDAFSSAGVLENISDSVIAIHTTNGSHCLDILRANGSSDPQWLVEQRRVEAAVIQGWLTKYYVDLRAFKS